MIGIIMGTRPHVPKVYSLVKALRERNLPYVILHANQHYDYPMQKLLFEQLGYSADVVMDKYSIGAAIDWAMAMIKSHDIRLLFTQGDSAPALVGAIAAVYSDIGLAHMEAGLRAFDKEMYEERNRLMVDDASHYLFTYTSKHAEYLSSLPHLRGRAFNVGNPTIDVLKDFADRIIQLHLRDYLFITLHRKELTDSKARLIQVLRALRRCAEELDLDLIFPMHPRTSKALTRFDVSAQELLGSRATLLPPVGFFESMSYQRYATVVVTDSGCIQEEACIFNVPCVTIRDNTERPETIEVGGNALSGFSEERIVHLVVEAAGKNRKWVHPYGAPGVGGRAINIVQENFLDFRSY